MDENYLDNLLNEISLDKEIDSIIEDEQRKYGLTVEKRYLSSLLFSYMLNRKKTWYTAFLMKIPEVNLLSINIVQTYTI